MDPMSRLLLERTYEAIVDSGFNPRHLHGMQTGVFIGSCVSETEKALYYKRDVDGSEIVGCSRAMLANRISFWLGVTGPSYSVDSACSSSLFALDHAYRAIRDGQCDSAIVGGCNLCLHPYISLQFTNLGVMSPDGHCRSFDESANGYCRSEAVCVLYLQRAKNARRIYATVVHVKTNCDGYKEQGITYPSGQQQQRLLEEFYVECNISPSSVAWVEAHGTGTKVGDPEEIKALENVFCPGREGPLPIGAVKSNMGHAEPASGLCSVTKVIIAMESGFIPPNINYEVPRKVIKAFHKGKISVVTEKTPWSGGLVGINGFGFGGANCHVLLKWNEKQKINGGAPNDDIPRIIPASGRTEQAVNHILTEVNSKSLDVEFVKLLHEIHNDNVPGHIYRGFTVIDKMNLFKNHSIKYYAGDKRPLWFVFSGMGSQWPGMGRDLMRIPVFASAIEKCHQFLKKFGLDIVKIITDTDPTIFENVINTFVGIASIQIGLVDVLTSVGLMADHIVGHSVGELGCAYADGCLTAEQTVLAAYVRGLASQQVPVVRGAMAAIGKGHMEIQTMLPNELDVACHNSTKSCTISGPASIVREFTEHLHGQNIFAKEVNVSNIPYHSRYITPVGAKLFTYLKQVIPNPMLRSIKWVSSSVAKCNWNSPQAQLCSAEYLTNNLLSPVLFEEAIEHVQCDAITVEIAPHGLLQSVLRHSLDQQTLNISLTHRGSDNSLVLVTALGKLYEAGLNPQLSALYPEVTMPVSRGTAMIGPLTLWNHSEDWYVASFCKQEKIKSGKRTVIIDLKNETHRTLVGLDIDRFTIYPVAGYLTLVWETMALMIGKHCSDVSVVFENVDFHRNMLLLEDGLILTVNIERESGEFEVREGQTAVVSGRIYIPDNIKEAIKLYSDNSDSNTKILELSSDDFYKELRLRGYCYKGIFQSVIRSSIDGSFGKVFCNKNWIVLIDSLLQLYTMTQGTRDLFLPASIDRLVIDIDIHKECLKLDQIDNGFPVHVHSNINIVEGGGIQIKGLATSPVPRKSPLPNPILETYRFYPYIVQNEETDLDSFVRLCLQLALENSESVTAARTVEILDNCCHYKADILSPIIFKATQNLPIVQIYVTVHLSSDHPKACQLGADIHVTDSKSLPNNSAMIVVASQLFTLFRKEVLDKCVSMIKENGFILSREPVTSNLQIPKGFNVCLLRHVGKEKLVLVQKRPSFHPKSIISINIGFGSFKWVPKLQAAIKHKQSDEKIILYTENEYVNGILGLLKCLQKEFVGWRLSCVFVMDSTAPHFSVELDMYKDQLEKNLAVNILKNGVWGSYCHLPLVVCDKVPLDHAYINISTSSDLRSVNWQEGPLRDVDVACERSAASYISVYYSAVETLVTNVALNQDSVFGVEFSGRTEEGKRVMGISKGKCLANKVVSDLVWDVPDAWTLEQAATVPVAYIKAMYALVIYGNIKKGDTVLIHRGADSVGQAAIHLALSYGCRVFTTVGSTDKLNFIRQTFPQIDKSHIGNSENCLFEDVVMTGTSGRGVDIVFNFLDNKQLLASVRCLADGGRFLQLATMHLEKGMKSMWQRCVGGKTLILISLDSVFSRIHIMKSKLHHLLNEAILHKDAVKPLHSITFLDNQVEDAFRCVRSEKYIGKVLIQLKKEENNTLALPVHTKILGRKRILCNRNSSCIIIGGLGGFGLELADWLVSRGCKNLLLTTRSGVNTSYQAMRIDLWRSYAVTVVISKSDVTTEQGVVELLNQANKLGPVQAIFNVAVVLKDALFDNQTEEDFKIVAEPKSIATLNLDNVSRKLCPSLEHFVVFSSLSCGRGNVGQTNYGKSNSTMERICELRRSGGYPALAIQWGPIGDVGLLSDLPDQQLELIEASGGALMQDVRSCLAILDDLLFCGHAVVASRVMVEKQTQLQVSLTIVDTVARILEITNRNSISPHSTLAELGMDSTMVVEIKHMLQKVFKIHLTFKELRSMTFAKLQELDFSMTKLPETCQSI